MPLELETIELQIGTIKVLSYQVDDPGGMEFGLISATYQIVDRATGEVVQGGDAVVNNEDLDEAGNAVKSVMVTLDLTIGTSGVRQVDGYDPKIYLLLIHWYADTGDDDIIKAPIRVVNVGDVFLYPSPRDRWTTTTTTTTTTITTTETTTETTTTTPP